VSVRQVCVTKVVRGNGAFYLLIAGAFAFLTIPRMAQAGMFVDGVTYAAISRNLADGVGRVWAPFYTATVYPQFFDHPPLGFVLQAAAFAVFGDHLAVERGYAVALGGLTGLLIMLIWRDTVRDAAYDWLPIIFWLLPSVVTWSIVNNMLETTQAAFTTLAVFAFVHSFRSSMAWAWGLLAGCSILGAVLTKGPTGFFPLATPLIAALVLRDRAREALRTGAMMLVAVVAVGAVVCWPSAPRAALSTYWDQQVVASMSGARVGGERWSSLARHLTGGVLMRMGALFALAGVCCSSFARSTDDRSGKHQTAWTVFFLVLALAGSLPIALSERIAGHYLVPSIPLYALGFASLSLPVIGPAFNRWRGRKSVTRVIGSLGMLLIIGSVAVPVLAGALERRDVDWMTEFGSLSSSVPGDTTLGTCEAVKADWGLHAYMMRFFSVSLDAEPEHDHAFYLQLTDRECAAPPACRPTAITNRFVLLACQVGGP